MATGERRKSERIIIDPWQETGSDGQATPPVGAWDDRQDASETDEPLRPPAASRGRHVQRQKQRKPSLDAALLTLSDFSARFSSGLKDRGLSAEKPEGGPRSSRLRDTVSYFRMRGVHACAIVMALGLFIGLIFFARPATSTLENRTLTPFPAITAESFLNGSFFTDLSLWYADTYPLREPMVGTAQAISNFYGVQPDQAFYGGNRQSDELPVVESSSSSMTSSDTSEAQVDTGPGGVAQRSGDIEPPDMKTAEANLEAQITNGIYMTEGACYTLYYFSQDACEEYCGVVNEAADALDGIANVYSIVLPTNAGVMLDEKLQQDLGGAVQEQAIDYFYSRMSDKVTCVETFDPLKEHKDEYLYFRTDHHWTQLAAYYVYESFCKAKGIEPADYDSWEEVTYEPFLGAYYSEIGVAGMANYADSVVARIPAGTNDMVYWPNDLLAGSEVPGNIITDLSNADPTTLYQTFVCGNQPLSKIENPAITDGSSCLIIKDSFGNPLTSVLAGSYQTVYTFDFRYSSQDLVSFVKAHSIQDVIIENCVMFAGTYDAAGMIGMIVDGTNRELAGAGPDVEAPAAQESSSSQTEGGQDV